MDLSRLLRLLPVPVCSLAAALVTVHPAAAQAQSSQRVILSELIVLSDFGPVDFVLDANAVYRLEVVPSEVTGATTPLEPLSMDGQWVGVAFGGGSQVAIRPARQSEPPLQVRPALEQGSLPRHGGVTVLLFPRASGVYRLVGSAAQGVTLDVRIVRTDADQVEWGCIRERDAGAAGTLCTQLHASRAGRLRYGLSFLIVVLPALIAIAGQH